MVNKHPEGHSASLRVGVHITHISHKETQRDLLEELTVMGTDKDVERLEPLSRASCCLNDAATVGNVLGFCFLKS